MSAISADGLGKRYGRRWALRDCTLDIPEGAVVGLVGPNGAGKSTFLHLAVGLLQATEGDLMVLGGQPGSSTDELAKVGFVAQDAPLYGSLTVADHLKLGAHTNPSWDPSLAKARVDELGLDPRQRAGRLSGGQRSQLALSLAMAKRPELLVLDEPVASLDPLARRAFLADVMTLMAGDGLTVLLSSHLLSDIERICDYLIVMVQGVVAVDGPVEALLQRHKILTGPRRDLRRLPADQVVVQASHTERQTTVVVRTDHPILDPSWVVEEIGLEALVLAYMAGPADRSDATRLRALAS
jgi:ABC-2 type transport system ATP-binding protein